MATRSHVNPGKSSSSKGEGRGYREDDYHNESQKGGARNQTQGQRESDGNRKVEASRYGASDGRSLAQDRSNLNERDYDYGDDLKSYGEVEDDRSSGYTIKQGEDYEYEDNEGRSPDRDERRTSSRHQENDQEYSEETHRSSDSDSGINHYSAKDSDEDDRRSGRQG